MVTDFTSVSYSQSMVRFIHDSKGYRGERIKYSASDVKRKKEKDETRKSSRVDIFRRFCI